MDKVDVTRLKAFKPGDDLSGRKIRSVVGRNDEFMVCTVELTQNGDIGVKWLSVDSYTFSERQRIHLAAFNERYDAVKLTFRSDPAQVEALAFTLFQALCAPSKEPNELFRTTDVRLAAAKEEASSRTRAVYGVFAAILALVAAVVLGALAADTQELAGVAKSSLFLTAAFGGFGALSSVLQKLRKLEVSYYPGFPTAAFGGCSRVLLGSIFGMVLFLAAKGGLVLSALTDLPGGVLLIGFVGGISERLVPDLIMQLESPR